MDETILVLIIIILGFIGVTAFIFLLNRGAET